MGALTLTATLILATAACSDDKNEGPTADATTTTSKVATSTSVKPEQLPSGHFIDLRLPAGLTAEEKEVAGAYRDALEAYARAIRSPKPNTDLSSSLTGHVLSEAKQHLNALASESKAARTTTPRNFGIHVVDANVTSKGAGMLVCLTDMSEIYSTKTGKQLEEPGAPHQVAVVLERMDNSWRLSRSAPLTTNEGAEKPCDS